MGQLGLGGRGLGDPLRRILPIPRAMSMGRKADRGERVVRTWDPQPFRAIVMDMAPSNSCPPFFAPSTACERRIAPAQVPHTGLVFTNSLSGSRTPERRARSAIVVLSVLIVSNQKKK